MFFKSLIRTFHVTGPTLGLQLKASKTWNTKLVERDGRKVWELVVTNKPLIKQEKINVHN